ncbi:hypothetical protein Acid345_3372 [Candidatus Koribacter versatilis Ellin345]|uniref:Uncharacterized protein n=1 Tax=Koribacter versatilis (strain Ellin345) TaxID=204669 RepID=Q1IL77_KORVE|nr:hypothetical protein Acid345_3372 [Candidatus Koribacter versatilis Ellin345]
MSSKPSHRNEESDVRWIRTETGGGFGVFLSHVRWIGTPSEPRQSQARRVPAAVPSASVESNGHDVRWIGVRRANYQQLTSRIQRTCGSALSFNSSQHGAAERVKTSPNPHESRAFPLCPPTSHHSHSIPVLTLTFAAGPRLLCYNHGFPAGKY